MASQLLDYNQVTEQSANTGDAIPSGGGLLTWNFRADPNLAWDPSQTFFVMRVRLQDSAITGSGATQLPGQKLSSMVDHWPLRLFNSMAHIVDGVTVASSQQPWADKFFQQRYLKENTVSNGQNLETQLSQSGIFASFLSGTEDKILDPLDLESIVAFNHSNAVSTATKPIYTTVVFQPPFDFWTKHQRCSGGNHQIQLNLRAKKLDVGSGADALPSWGPYCIPGLSGSTTVANAGAHIFSLVDERAPTVSIDRIRLCRRMVRFNIERPLQVQEFNLTEMQFFHGTAVTLGGITHNSDNQATGTSAEQSQNFILPSSTFGIALYWRHANDSQYTPLGPQGPLGDSHPFATGAQGPDILSSVQLEDLYFSYGGETYPAQRITELGENEIGGFPGYQQMQLLSHQLQGVFNMPMDYVQGQFRAQRGLKSLNDKLYYFPVAKHNNSDNSDLQIFYKARLEKICDSLSADPDVPISHPINLVVVAFYDARAEFTYNSMNQLEKVTKTEWK